MSGTSQRFSILHLMTVVSILAAECGYLRFVLETTIEIAVVVFPLLNFMLLGLVQSRRNPPSRFFWIGFEWVGLALLALLCFMVFFTPQTLSFPLQWINDRHWLSGEGPEQLAISIGVVASVYGIPQLLAASAGGWLSGRYPVVIERRPREAAEDAGRPADIPAFTSFQNVPRPAAD